MDNKTAKKILIIGNTSAEFALAQKLLNIDTISEVYVAPGNEALKEICKTADIRENNIKELLEFAMENAIDLTIVTSEMAIKQNIVETFQQNHMMIFAPTKDSAVICTSKSAGKKFMYKHRIPCPKFAIFDKSSPACDYVSKSNFPVVVKSDGHKNGNTVYVCNTFQNAKTVIEEFFEKGEEKVIIEDYIFGHEFSLYAITDGYHAISVGTVANYKHELEGNGGNLTAGQGAFSPDYKISSELEQQIMNNVIYPTLDSLAKSHAPYVGILGVDFVLDDYGNYYAIEFNPFLNSPDAEVILALIEENIYDLFEACVIGAFADDYDHIHISDSTAVACVLNSKNSGEIITGLDELEDETQITHLNSVKNKYLEFETKSGRTLILTRTARTLSKAVKDLYEEIDMINFNTMKYRKDIAKI